MLGGESLQYFPRWGSWRDPQLLPEKLACPSPPLLHHWLKICLFLLSPPPPPPHPRNSLLIYPQNIDFSIFIQFLAIFARMSLLNQLTSSGKPWVTRFYILENYHSLICVQDWNLGLWRLGETMKIV